MKDSYSDIAKDICTLIVKNFVDDKITDTTTNQEIIDMIKELIDRALNEIDEQDDHKRREFHQFFKFFTAVMIETMDEHIICNHNFSRFAQINRLTK